MRTAQKAMAAGLVALVGVGLWGAVAQAQSSRDQGRVLHRYFEAHQWFGEDGTPGPAGAATGEGPGSGSAALRPRSSAGEAPGLWLSPAPGEWILTAQGPLGGTDIEAPHGALTPGAGETELDDRTDYVDDLDYQANFEPSVVPFKRGVAQNAIRQRGVSYAATLESGDYETVAVGGDLGEQEQRFWGTFLVRMEPGERHSIPSVAPDQRVLSVQSEPAVALEISRDEADNFYLRGDHRGLVRINLELGVDSFYFGGELGAQVGWEDLPTGRGLSDFELLRRSEEVLEMVGVDRASMTPRRALDRLVEYHRGFEMRAGDELGDGDRYVAISRERVGVCRHRSLVFMISAQALGIATRYVYNEAHAFVEIQWPGQGWRRIDLGGAAQDFNFQGPAGGGVHDESWDDEFPRPASYEAELEAMTGGDGGVDDDSAEASSQHEEAEASTEPSRQETAGDGHRTESGESLEDSDLETAGEELSPTQGPMSTPPRVEILDAAGEVFRGQQLRVRGQVVGERAVDSVAIYLVPSGAQNVAQGVLLGEADVGQNFAFDGEWTVPRQVNLGRWRLVGQVVNQAQD